MDLGRELRSVWIRGSKVARLESQESRLIL